MMFPLRDTVPRVHTPWAVWTILGINLLVMLMQQILTPQEMHALFNLYGVVPARFAFPQWGIDAGYPAGGYISFVTHMFLHGGWSHFLVNMWTLWIFGGNVEDVMGTWRFGVFYFLCGFAALLTHVCFSASSTSPIVGASGAVAGVLGAYFILYPHSRVTTLVLLLFIPLVFDIPAVLYLGIWFAMQLLSGLTALTTANNNSIAWWAHLGGFVAGVFFMPLFRQPGRCYFCSADGLFPRARPASRRNTPQCKDKTL